MTRKIVYTTNFKRGGLGDFLNGALSIYSICRESGYDFEIYLPPEHPFVHCFELPKERSMTCKHLIMDAQMMNGDEVRRRIQREMKGFPMKAIMVSTNVPDIVSEDRMDEIVEDFMKVLRPSELIRRVVAFIRDKMRIQEGGYISIHARCGDAHLEGARLNPLDDRASPADVIKRVLDAVAAVREGRCADSTLKGLPVVLHTDSMEVRQALIGRVRVFGGKIQHTGEEGEIQGFVDAIAEFYVMAEAKEIFYVSPSGFSRFAALFRGIYAKPLDELFVDEDDVQLSDEEEVASGPAPLEEAKVEEEVASGSAPLEEAKVEEEVAIVSAPLEEAKVEEEVIPIFNEKIYSDELLTPLPAPTPTKKNKKRKNNK